MFRPWCDTQELVQDVNANEEQPVITSSDDEDVSSSTKGHHLSEIERKLMFKVYKNLKVLEPDFDDTSIIKKAAFLTEVSTSSVYRIIKSVERGHGFKRKRRENAGVLKQLDSQNNEDLKQCVYEMYKRNEVPALETLQKTLLEDYNINCSKATLKRRLNSSGFRFKALDKRQVILDSRRLVEWRRQYLRDIKKFRSEGRFVCYLDETWYDTHGVIKKGWVDESKKCVLAAPVAKGKRIIILHAGSDKGWIGQYLLSGRNSSSCKLDYHEDMAADLFEKWFENQLLPDLPPNSVIVMDTTTPGKNLRLQTATAQKQNFRTFCINTICILKKVTQRRNCFKFSKKNLQKTILCGIISSGKRTYRFKVTPLLLYF